VKRVLLLIKALGRGGAERLLVNTVRYIDRSKFDVEVAYLLPRVADLLPCFEEQGVPVRCLDGERGARWLWRLRRLVRERQIDLVHSHSPYAAVGARVALATAPVRLVYTEHALRSSYHPATSWANLMTFSANDHVFAVSNSVRASMRCPGLLRWLPAPTVETLYHGNDPADVERWSRAGGARRCLGLRDDAAVVGTVANFLPGKGHEHLLHAASRVRRARPDVRFVLVGGGPLEAVVRRQVRELGLAETVVFAGYREDAPVLAGAFDIFVLPSIREGFSLALIEAMALGTPVVVTQSGGPAEIVEHGRHGCVVPVADAASLAEAILGLLEDGACRQRLSVAARRRAGDFDIRRAVRRLEAVYEDLLA
jgi:glycosyltransferase involved in cell wall biosynthesis